MQAAKALAGGQYYQTNGAGHSRAKQQQRKEGLQKTKGSRYDAAKMRPLRLVPSPNHALRLSKRCAALRDTNALPHAQPTATKEGKTNDKTIPNRRSRILSTLSATLSKPKNNGILYLVVSPRHS